MADDKDSEPGVRIVGGQIEECGIAISVSAPNAHISVDGTAFKNNGQDFVATDGLRRLDMKDYQFDAEKESPKDEPAGKLKGLIQGFSFSKGDHLK